MCCLSAGSVLGEEHRPRACWLFLAAFVILSDCIQALGSLQTAPALESIFTDAWMALGRSQGVVHPALYGDALQGPG